MLRVLWGQFRCSSQGGPQNIMSPLFEFVSLLFWAARVDYFSVFFSGSLRVKPTKSASAV